MAVLRPVVVHRVEHGGGAAHECLALAPVRAQGAQIAGPDAAGLRRVLFVQAEARKPSRQAPQLGSEDHLLARAGGMQDHRLGRGAASGQRSQHAHDRRDAAAGADEEQPVRQGIGQHEGALHAAEADDRPRPRVSHQVWGDLARLHQLRRDADGAVGTTRIGGQRVGAPVVDPVHDHADPEVLAGLMALPLPAGLDDDRGGVVSLPAHLLDSPPQLLRGPERVDELQVVVRQERGEHGAHGAQYGALCCRNLGAGASLSDGLSLGRRSRRILWVGQQA